ncbi:MAG: hypothetical protein ABI741_13805 [Ferruginibacter sp.]
MKKISILMLMVFSAISGMAQSLDEINEMMGKKDYAAAKTAIDKYLSDAKNSSKADGWYYKGRIYNSLSYEKSTPESSLYDLKNSAYESFKKYQQLESNDINRMKLENFASYLDLYFGLYDLGANLFNNKNYSAAYDAFKKALEVKDYTLGKKYIYPQATLYPLDTALVLNTAIAATQAKKEDDAAVYYRKLVDANVTGETYRDVYELLVDYYNKKADAASLADVIAKGKKYYPTDNYWNQVEIDNIAKTGDQAATFAKYEEMIAKDPANFTMAYNYAVVLYNKINDKDKPMTDLAIKDKLSSVLKNAIAIDPGIDATVLMAGHLYTMAVDYFNAASIIKGTKPEDIKKKNELKALATKKMDECIPFSENAIKYFEGKTDLKGKQIANYKIILSNLSDIYSMKGDKKRSDEYDKKRESIK